MSLKVYREDPETQELKPETWYYWKSSEGLYSKDITTEEGKQMHISLTKEDVLRDWKSANISKDFTGEILTYVSLNEIVNEEEMNILIPLNDKDTDKENEIEYEER